MPRTRPNILMIQADQMAVSALPFHGHPVVRAPEMARLAAAGVVFEQAYCNAPLCAPSRFSMLSGQLASTIGAYDNAAELPASVPTFVHHLRRLGYHTCLAGKMHFVGPDQLHGFEERLTTDIYPADFGWTPDWERPDERQSYFHTMLSVVEADVCERSLQVDFDDEVGHQAARKLYDFARAGQQRPFFLLVSFTHPHDPYTITREYWERYRPEEIDPPRVPPLPAERQDPHSRRLAWASAMDDYDLSPERVRNARRAYYGAISYVDDKVAALLAALGHAGLAEDTVVVLTADHGDMLGERGLWYKMTFYDPAARVPLVVHAPHRFASRRVTSVVSLVDLFPTLIDLAGGDDEPAEPLAGHSLLPLLAGDDTGSGEAFGEYMGEAAAGPLVMIRRGRHKYVASLVHPPQLFDLAADPLELDDLAGRPEHAALAEAFAAEVAQRWDLDKLKREVILSQRRRRLVFEALSQGTHTPWDHQPFVDAARLYARNLGVDLGDLERRGRLPLRPPPEPDGPGAAATPS